MTATSSAHFPGAKTMMIRGRRWIGFAVSLILVAIPQPLRSQQGVSAALEVGIGTGYAGHGVGASGKLLAHVVGPKWGIGARAMHLDGARRRATSCFIFCNPIENFTEKSILLYRRLASADNRHVFFGAGVGVLTGRRFIGSTTEFERDLSEVGLSLDLSLHAPPGSRIRFAPSAFAHVGSGGITAGIVFGVALAR